MLSALEAIITFITYIPLPQTLFTQKTCFVLQHLVQGKCTRSVSLSISLMYLFSILRCLNIHNTGACGIGNTGYLFIRPWSASLPFSKIIFVLLSLFGLSDKDSDDNYISYLLGADAQSQALGARNTTIYIRRNHEQTFCICFSRSSWETSIMQKTACFFSLITYLLFWVHREYERHCFFNQMLRYVGLSLSFPFRYYSTCFDVKLRGLKVAL